MSKEEIFEMKEERKNAKNIAMQMFTNTPSQPHFRDDLLASITSSQTVSEIRKALDWARDNFNYSDPCLLETADMLDDPNYKYLPDLSKGGCLC